MKTNIDDEIKKEREKNLNRLNSFTNDELIIVIILDETINIRSKSNEKKNIFSI